MYAHVVFLIAGLPMVRGAASKFRYPLAVSTGSAETEFGGVAEDNPCSTDAFTVHPALPYSPIYLTGSEKSFLKLNLGRGKVISNQWSMSMFVYSVAPHYGTIFHYVCTATTDVTLVKLYTKEIKLTLNSTHMMFKMVTTLNIEYSIEIPSIITTESWIPIAIAYDYSNGEFTLMTENNKFYEETDAPDTLKNVHIGQPATITLGRSSVNPSTPFQGSIVCFGVYDTKISDNNFNSLLDECQPSNWAVVPPTGNCLST